MKTVVVDRDKEEKEVEGVNEVKIVAGDRDEEEEGKHDKEKRKHA